MAVLALTLFDHLEHVHGLSPERRNLVEIAAMVHNIGIATDPVRHHAVGRDILLTHPPVGFDDFERRVLAVSTFLHRKKMTTSKIEKVAERDMTGMTEEARTIAFAVAALVRLADGLDYSQGNSHIGRIEHSGGAVAVDVVGPFAGVDADRATQKSDLWNLLFDSKISFRANGGMVR